MLALPILAIYINMHVISNTSEYVSRIVSIFIFLVLSSEMTVAKTVKEVGRVRTGAASRAMFDNELPTIITRE